MNGTEKQVAWAETIRSRHLRDGRALISERLTQMADAAAAHNPTRAAYDRYLADGENGADALLDALEAKDDARWWIDRRDKSAWSLLKEIAREIGYAGESLSDAESATKDGEKDA